jgi:flagellar basal-body rod modification protein FlgD
MIDPSEYRAGYSGTPIGQDPTGRNAFEDVDMGQFIDLMIAELQHQDPMNPMDNSQMMEQLGQIREIAASDKLTESLDSVMLGQTMATSANLLGKKIEGLDEYGERAEGLVDGISIVEGKPVLKVGLQKVAMSDISKIYAEQPVSEESPADQEEEETESTARSDATKLL